LLRKHRLPANLTVCSMYKRLPYEDAFFDAVISIRSLNHGTIDQIRTAIMEIERVLRERGLVYVTVRKRVPKRKRLPFKEIAPRTYVPLEGSEMGVVHYLFNKALLREEFGAFKILSLTVDHGPLDWECYYSLLGELR
jgi:ubiquinone/menaquinone biosynthesis C-methylase UbiE